MIFEQFSEGRSPIHRLDPRVKICAAVCLAFIVSLSSHLSSVLAGVFLGVVLLFAAGLKLRLVLRRLGVIFGFMALVWVFLPFSVPGEEVFTVFTFTATYQGLFYAVSITLKSASVIFFIIALLSTTELFSLFHALYHLKVPEKLVQLTFFCYRYIHVIHREYVRMRNALKIRAFRPHTNVHTYKTYAYLIAMLLVRSYDRSERVYRAMLCRGFTGQFYVLQHFSISKKDIIFGVLTAVYAVIIIWLDWIVKPGIPL
ncbi:MAG: cobalt ECF transporter T component CbiQ [Spirochaetota bacterium]